MAAAAETPRASAPVHLWIVGLIALAWNGFGAYDYLMSKTQGDAYLHKMGESDAMIAHMHAYPVWMTADWAIGVWSGVIGALLLLARMRYAFHVFALSLAAMLVMLVYTYLLSDGLKVGGSQGLIFNGVLLAFSVFFAWYSRAMANRGVLR